PFPITKIPYIHNGFFYDGDEYIPAKHPYYFAGLYYLQDPSAMTPASRLPVSPGDRVLDLCAAPGGKSTELAAKLAGEGVLVANDISPKRAKALQKNLELFGVGEMCITTEYPEKLCEYFEGYFDKILIDAPCSGEGMFRKDPAMIKAWTADSPDEYASIQEGIVKAAVKMLADDGYMLYSTCTFSPVEDEGTVLKLLEADSSLEIVEPEWYEGFEHGKPEVVGSDDESLKKCIRIFPHKMDGEGHFLALFHKIKSGNDRPATVKKNKQNKRISKEDKEVWEEFSNRIKKEYKSEYIEDHAGKLYYKEFDMPTLNGLKFIRDGLYLGECKKGRFEPSQALAMALRSEEYANAFSMPVSDDRVTRYLKGETIVLEESEAEKINDGIVLICVDGYPLGWGKKNRSNIKNKYHSGWRLM
nr:RsmB/NOP family class I SAM-dependent RNA methyltransferase [Eubacterium sp.]